MLVIRMINKCRWNSRPERGRGGAHTSNEVGGMTWRVDNLSNNNRRWCWSSRWQFFPLPFSGSLNSMFLTGWA